MYEPIKKLGQNFLTDPVVVHKMLEVLEVTPNDNIVEIGPGLGILTEELSNRLDRKNSLVYAVEIDERLWTKVNQMFLEQGNVIVVYEDILEWLKGYEPDYDFKVLGSLPYYITSPIIHSIIKLNKRPSLAVLLIQKEVAQKITAKAPDSSYLSSFVQTFFEVEYVETVSKSKFKPQPKVDGGIIKLTRKNVDMPKDIVNKYEGFLHKAYQSPRKMLNKPFKKEQLEIGGIDPKLRPQNLNNDDWLEFFFKLHDSGKL
jgi:16S rRNA (adenine1518-N6/adenine1519-N6)-dimethyltransferase